MNRFLLIVIFLVVAYLRPTQAQIKVVEEIEKELYSYRVGTVYETSLWQLKDGQIKLSYRSQDPEDVFLAEVLFKNKSEFDSLYEIIQAGFDQKNNFPIKVDLGNSYFYLYYDYFLFGVSRIRFSHAYKSSPYARITSTHNSRKEIDKLFGRQALNESDTPIQNP